jgi:hypothetical protein
MFRIWTMPLPPAAAIWQSGLNATSTKSFSAAPVVMLPTFAGAEAADEVPRAHVFTLSDAAADAEELAGAGEVGDAARPLPARKGPVNVPLSLAMSCRTTAIPSDHGIVKVPFVPGKVIFTVFGTHVPPPVDPVAGR